MSKTINSYELITMEQQFKFSRLIFWTSSQLMRVLQQFAGATMLSTGILYFGKYLWWIYIQTPVGHQYVSLFGERAIVVTALFSQDLLRIAFDINLIVLQTSLLVALLCHSLFIKTTFYDSQGITEHLVFWSMPVSFVAFLLLPETYGMDLTVFILLWLIPSQLILTCCMRLVGDVLPDGLLLNIVYNLLYKIYQVANCVVLRRCEI